MGQEAQEPVFITTTDEKKWEVKIPKDNWLGFGLAIFLSLICFLSVFLPTPSWRKESDRPDGMMKFFGAVFLIGGIYSLISGCSESEKRRVANEPVVSYKKLSEYDGWRVLRDPDMTYSVVDLMGPKWIRTKLHIDKQVAHFMLAIPKIGEGRDQFFCFKDFVGWLEERKGKSRDLPELVERAEELTRSYE
ncbi:MAG: hypothetical protein AAB389_01930 [Patescibacteria group bacterium]